ncbi:protoglobin domain-containing protein [Campylobacterota bacterium DY0563]
MNNFKKLLNHYKFDDNDAKTLYSIKDIAFSNIEKLLNGFYQFIFEFEHAKKFLHNKEILKKHQIGIKNWYLNLFCGKYEEEYFNNLDLISEVHVNIGLPAHYVNAAFSYIRRFIIKRKYA